MAREIDKIIQSTNMVSELKEKELEDISKSVIEGFKTDLLSRSKWEKSVDQWTKLALQTVENKNWPWPKASNVKYPLLATAAMQFCARAYPSLVPSNGQIVQAKVIGIDPNGEKAKRAERVAKYMSYQLMEEMDDWEEEMDRLLMILPIVGVCFKKTYWDKGKTRNCSKLILPKSLVVNYWAKSLEDTERKTEIIEMSDRVLQERMREGVYEKYKDLPRADLASLTEVQGAVSGNKDNTKQTSEPAQADESTPHILLEQHGFRDIDGDGYPEPYITTVHLASGKVMRITARFKEKDIYYGDDGKISCITPTEYYTKYGFIPNPDGGFYDVGFGLLLGPINRSINTAINQLLDAGTLSNLQSGFLSKSLRMGPGEVKFKAGEWKWVNATAETLQKGVFPMPVREPNQTILKLLELLITSGKELASIAEIFVGKMPGQNTPATTTMASVEQGMKLFTAIYKRIYRALTSEYWKLYELNHVYLNPETAVQVMDDKIGPEDFDLESMDIKPAADPTAFSSTQKLLKAQALAELIPLGTINPMEVTKRILEAQEQPNIEQVMLQQQAPDPKQQEMQQKMQLEQAKAQSKMAMDKMKMELEARSEQLKTQMESSKARMEIEHKQRIGELDLRIKAADHRAKMVQGAQQNQMTLATKGAQHQQTMQQMKEKQQFTASKQQKSAKK